MGSFNRGGRGASGGFNRGGFGGAKKFGGRDGDRPAMHQATCSECGDDCEIPFRPVAGRPVFCSTCFGKQKGEESRPSRFDSGRDERPRFEDRRMHDAICADCGQSCQVPFKPMGGKPVFCSNCFDKDNRREKPSFAPAASNSGEMMDQFKILNNKIDKLIKLLAPEAVVVEEKVVEPVKEKKIKVKVAAKKVVAKKKK